MGSERSTRSLRAGLGSAAALGLLASVAVAAEEPAPARCRTDALDQWYCASEPQGAAVVDSLGVVLCAPGGCVEVDGEWQCSSIAGGGAELTPSGPVCAGGCRTPRAADCQRM